MVIFLYVLLLLYMLADFLLWKNFSFFVGVIMDSFNSVDHSLATFLGKTYRQLSIFSGLLGTE